MPEATVKTTPAREPAALSAATLCEAFQITAAEDPEGVAHRTPGDAVSITWAEYAQRVPRIAAGLAALGVERGDAMALMLVNRPEFNLVDTAALHLGATPFSVYNTSSPEQIEYLLSSAGNRVIVTEQAFLPVMRAAAERSGGIEHIVLVDGDEDGVVSLERLQEMDSPGFDFEAAWRAVEPGDIATLIYTSGTTGPPKGVELTHRNLLAEVRGMGERLGATPHGRATSYLPAAHIADRWSSHYQASIVYGCTVTSFADPRAVIAGLPEVRPTFWGSVPRIWEKLKAALEAQGLTDPSRLPEEQKAAMRAKLGLDECEALVVGAAPSAPDVLSFFEALGLPICELWGMSETSSMRDLQSAGRDQGRDLRPGPLRSRAAAGRGPRAAGARRHRDGGYRGDPEKTARRSTTTAGCTPATSPRSTTTAT